MQGNDANEYKIGFYEQVCLTPNDFIHASTTIKIVYDVGRCVCPIRSTITVLTG